MLLPSGRSNSDVYSQEHLKNHSFTSSTSASILYDKISETQNRQSTSRNVSNLETEEEKPQPLGLMPALDQSSSVKNGIKKSVGFHDSIGYDTEKTIPAHFMLNTNQIESIQQIESQLNAIQNKLEEGWTVHVRKDGRLYYCNHLTRSSSWLPSIEDWIKIEDLPYGWERAIDSKGRSYYLNHQNKTTTYEAPENIKHDANPPQPRLIILERSPNFGFGFVAGSERPVLVRFITEGGPSINKLLPGDQILEVNGEDVKEAPRDHVIQLIRTCETQVTLLVCQPMLTCASGRKSTLLSAGKRAKLRSRPNRVRFAESVCVNGAPLFPPSAFSLSDICVPPMANVLKVFLENGQTKSFKYDTTTTVQDVMTSLLDKLCLKTPEIFSLVLEHVKSLKRNKFSLLDPEESLARIAARPGAHKLRCLFRVTFVPTSPAELAEKDINSLDYLYMQCCNDVTQERFAPELQPEMALRLATLQMYQHASANNFCSPKLSVKIIEREFGLERFLPPSLIEGMKRKELRRLLQHFHVEMTSPTQKLFSVLQAKLNYLDIIATLPSYGAKCFSTNQRIGVERVILVGPRFGLSQITNARNSVPQAISTIGDLSHVIINNEDDVNYCISIFMNRDRLVKFSMEDRDAVELSLVLAGYYRLLTGNVLTVMREQKPDIFDEDNAPPFLAQHTVLPACWSYLESYHDRAHSVNFFNPPNYHYIGIEKQFYNSDNCKSECILDCSDFNNSQSTRKNDSLSSCGATMDLDIHSVVATELLEEAKDSGLSDSSGGGSNYCDQQHKMQLSDKDVEVLKRVQEMQQMVENSEQYLNEQGEMLQICAEGSLFDEDKNFFANQNNKMNPSNWNDLDSDCESLNSSKVSFQEENSQQGALNHSDSLVLLAEIINKDLNGISNGLNSINENTAVTTTNRYSPCLESRDKTLSQLLENIQLNLDSSQYESDAESILSPLNSPTSQRCNAMSANVSKVKQNEKSTFRGSFGLHSPDEFFDSESKGLNFKKFMTVIGQDYDSGSKTDKPNETEQKLSQFYSDALVENDSDLIDLRAIPPPRTPDDLDAYSLVNLPPHGFADGTLTNLDTSGKELDEFLEKVVVAPPIQKITPSKELTPEEIMSFIIPPPPNLNTSDTNSENVENIGANTASQSNEEGFYSNSDSIHLASLNPNHREETIIEYATVERKGRFFCCPKKQKCEINNVESDQNRTKSMEDVPIPPRQKSKDKLPPARPPKSADLIRRLSPKKNCNVSQSFQFPDNIPLRMNETPPSLPPRPNQARLVNNSNSTNRFNANDKSTHTPSHSLVLPLFAMQRENCLNSVSPNNFDQSSMKDSPDCSTRKRINLPSDIESPSSSKALSSSSNTRVFGEKIIIKNGHIIDTEALLAKTEVAMAGLLVRLDQIAAQCAAAQSAGGGASIDEEKFQKARSELTEQTLALVTASKFLVVSMSDSTLQTLPEHLTSCLTAIRRITELTQDMTRHTSAPLQTRNIVFKVHDVASSFRELVQVEIGPIGAGQLALRAECLANVLATLLRSLRVFSP